MALVVNNSQFFSSTSLASNPSFFTLNKNQILPPHPNSSSNPSLLAPPSYETLILPLSIPIYVVGNLNHPPILSLQLDEFPEDPLTNLAPLSTSGSLTCHIISSNMIIHSLALSPTHILKSRVEFLPKASVESLEWAKYLMTNYASQSMVENKGNNKKKGKKASSSSSH